MTPDRPATALQQGIWVTERASPAPGTYHMPLVVRLRGPLDVDRLLRACADVAGRHPALGRVPAERDGRLVMVDGPAVPVDRVAASAFADELRRPFDITTGPLARFVLAEEGPADHVLGFVAHHLVFDGHSKQVLVRDLAAFHDGRHADLPDLGEPDAEAAPPAGNLVAEARTWWERHWPEAGVTYGPEGVPLPAHPSGRGAEARLAVTPRVPGLSAFEVLLAALHVRLWGYGTDAPVTAVVLSTRRPGGADDDRIGLFVNEVPFATAPAAGATFAEFGAEVRRALRELYRFRTVPLAVARPGLRPHTAVAPVSLSHREGPPGGAAFAGLTASVDWLGWGGGVRGLVQVVGARAGGADPAVDPAVDLAVRFDEAVDGPRVAADLAELLTAVTADPDRRLGELVGTRGPRRTVPDAAARPGRAPAEPAGAGSTELLEQVRLIWQEVLRIEPIEDDDDIFDLGGHSLNITQIITRMKAELQLEVSLDGFFDHSTVAGVVGLARRG